MMYEIKEMEEVCANCRFYIQHYSKRDDFYYVPVNAGHCTEPRIKDRKPSDVCKNFKARNYFTE